LIAARTRPAASSPTSRFPRARRAVQVALRILAEHPGGGLHDAKARAAAHGVRITAASVAAARRLLSRRDEVPAPAAPGREPARAPSASTPVAGAEQLEAVVREALAAGRPALPHSVRRELARLLLDGGRDRAVGGRTARHAGEGTA
jgi:hypothetical protein